VALLRQPELGYYTHYQEPEFGLLQLGVRFYDPEVGRFTQQDAYPVWEESSYSYAGGMPLVSIDPTGNWQWGWPPWAGPKPKPKPKPKPTPKPTPEEKAMKDLAKWFMGSVVKKCTSQCPEVGLGMNVVDQFSNLPEKFQNALRTCKKSAESMYESPDQALVDCMECYWAFVAVAGPGNKGNYWGSLISCSRLESCGK